MFQHYPIQKIVLAYLLILLATISCAKEFKQNGWTFSYPDGWYLKIEPSKITLSPQNDFKATNATKVIISYKKMTTLYNKYGAEKLLEMTAIGITGAERESVSKGLSQTSQEVRTIRRPDKKDNQKTARDRQNDKKWEEERKKQIEAQIEIAKKIDSIFKITNKQNTTFLDQKAIMLEFELKPDQEVIYKKEMITLMQDTVIIVVLQAQKNNTADIKTLEAILSTMRFKF